ncbi:MAG: hypothetical protein K2X93_04630, partial [Candidatus Obscuribacterales bacterium]|nr:hypothetical protein [Candidatus Obscuribacterales bacterium]
MSWPTPQDYNEAIQNPASCFHDSELKSSSVELNQLGLPKSQSGSFASVYKLQCGRKPYAVRCFLRFHPDQQERYEQISKFVRFDNLNCTVDFHYIEKGIKLHGNWYPIIKMPWIDGPTLDQYINQNFKSADKIGALQKQFFNLVMELEYADIAHGDLQHGNILVAEDGLKLVDYDALFVPALVGLPSHELGHPNYQHPMRTAFHFDPAVDNFSTWLIYSSLTALRVQSDLYTRFQGGDDCIIFKRRDLQSPETSELFRVLLNHDSAELKNVARILVRMLWESPHSIPPLHATAEELSRLPDIEPEDDNDPAVKTRLSAYLDGVDLKQSRDDIAHGLNTTIDQARALKGQSRTFRSIRFKARAANVRKSVEGNLEAFIELSLRKSFPVRWTSVTMQKGDLLFQKGEYSAAITSYLKVQTHRGDFLSDNPEEMAELQMRIGRAFAMDSNLPMACNHFKLASMVTTGERRDQAVFLLALANYLTGKRSEAVKIVVSCATLDKNFDQIIKREALFGFVKSFATIKLIEAIAAERLRKGNIRSSIEILETARSLSVWQKPHANEEFSKTYIDLLIQLGINYARLGCLAYTNALANDAEKLIALTPNTDVQKLRLEIMKAYVSKKGDLPLLASSSLGETLRGVRPEILEEATKSF